MKKLYILLILFLISGLFAAELDDKTNKTPSEPPPSASSQNKVYYGGTLGFNFFGDIFRIRIAPMVGYKITPQLSAGIKIGYEYMKDKRYSVEIESHNYGGSVFTRYRVIPQIYFHGEFVYVSYEYQTQGLSSQREWVPMLLLGAGFAQSVGGNTYVFAEVLFDVLRDSNSPYEDWDPIISFGASVGF
jgi:hypothetical protein